MYLGWLGLELAWCHSPAPMVDAFLYLDATLRCHVPLYKDCLLGRRHMRTELQALMQQPIVYSALEREYAARGERPIKLADTLWAMDRMRARWRAQAAATHCPYTFYCGFIHRPLPPLWGTPQCDGEALVRPRTGLCHAPGHLRATLLVPDREHTCLHQLPWQLYGGSWVPFLESSPPTMARSAHWHYLGDGRHCQPLGQAGEWRLLEGWV